MNYMLSPKIAIITGYAGAGKSSLANEIAKMLGRNVIEVGNAVRAAHREANSNLTLVEYADKQFSEKGSTCFIRSAVADCVHDSLIVGIRRPEELDWLIANYKSVIVIWIDTPIRERRKRAAISGKGGSQYLRMREKIEEGWGLESLRDRGDVVLDGSKSTKELVMEVLEWLSSK